VRRWNREWRNDPDTCPRRGSCAAAAVCVVDRVSEDRTERDGADSREKEGEVVRQNNRFEQIDKAALHNALLDLHTCPRCRDDLKPVALCEDVFGCQRCKETWHIPTVVDSEPEKRRLR